MPRSFWYHIAAASGLFAGGSLLLRPSQFSGSLTTFPALVAFDPAQSRLSIASFGAALLILAVIAYLAVRVIQSDDPRAYFCVYAAALLPPLTGALVGHPKEALAVFGSLMGVRELIDAPNAPRKGLYSALYLAAASLFSYAALILLALLIPFALATLRRARCLIPFLAGSLLAILMYQLGSSGGLRAGEDLGSIFTLTASAPSGQLLEATGGIPNRLLQGPVARLSWLRGVIDGCFIGLYFPFVLIALAGAVSKQSDIDGRSVLLLVVLLSVFSGLYLAFPLPIRERRILLAIMFATLLLIANAGLMLLQSIAGSQRKIPWVTSLSALYLAPPVITTLRLIF